jgi:hypothetical protein
MQRITFILFVLLFAVANLPADSDAWVLRSDGIGPVQVGMDLAQLNSALRASFPKPADRESQTCFYVEVPRHAGVRIMLLDGRVARVDVVNTLTRTAKGIRNGDAEAYARKVYGEKLMVSPHKYEPNGHYLTVHSADGEFGTRFETKAGKIVRCYAGIVRAIELVEGCG